MIKSILADSVKDDIPLLESLLSEDFPNINICAKAHTLSTVTSLVSEFNPALVFINEKLLLNNDLELNTYFSGFNYEVVLLTDDDNFEIDAINCRACGYLLKPIQKKHLGIAVNNAMLKISMKQENVRNKTLVEKYLKESSGKDVIGIPTIEGFEFIPIDEFIRCEGLRKCTLVFTRDRTDIISSYNIGEFKKLLQPFGFYSPHKSHLINMKYIRKYYRDGNILMVDGSYVPVAKRKKGEFLDQVKHI